MPIGRTRARLAVLMVVAGAIGGCGGSDEPSEERIARERKEAADQAAQKERLRQVEKELARERRERTDRTDDRQSSPPPPSPTPAPASSRTDCGGGISVGPNTSCSFAQNVRDEYRNTGGSSRIEVYSPVTKQTHTMSCTAGATTVCTGGNDAVVYFR